MFYKTLVGGLLAAVLVSGAATAKANVFNMGPGLTKLATVPVGDPGNVADTTAHSNNPGGQGAVAYAYNIGKYEVTAGQYTEFLNAVGKADMYGLYNASMWSDATTGCRIQQTGAAGSYTYSVALDYANRPVNYVSWGSAARFVNWLQNGQPTGILTGDPTLDRGLTEDGAYYLNGATTGSALDAVSRKTNWSWAIASADEWYKAAYYKASGTNTGYWNYPTSSDAQPGRDMADTSGNNANYADYLGPYLPIDSGTYWTTVAGEFQNSDSPYGTFDQGGNVFEWNEKKLSNGRRGSRGGSFQKNADYMRTTNTGPSFTAVDVLPTVGFRVVSVPEPGNLVMLVLGVLGLSTQLWRKRLAA